jgi:putative membrane protein
MTVKDIPALNAALNALATLLMTCGFVFIARARRSPDSSQRTAGINRHRTCMLLAGVVSAVFLVGYVAHKILVRGVHTPFGGTGVIAQLYYGMLISHILLAIAIAYLVPRTFYLALKGDFERHRRWARWTFPIWYYVSITGVLVYFFLYQWWPTAARAA